MIRSIRRRPLTAEALVLLRVSPCDICGWTKWHADCLYCKT